MILFHVLFGLVTMEINPIVMETICTEKKLFRIIML